MSVHTPLSGLDLGSDPGAGREHVAPEPPERDWEAEARAVGWKPLPEDPQNPQSHEYKGDPAKWTDARSFILTRDNNLGVMRENVNRLTDQNRRLVRDLEEMRRQRAEDSKKIDDLVLLAKDARASGYKQARRELEEQQREALRNGDEATFDKIADGLKEIDAAAAKLDDIGKKSAAPAATPAANEPPPPSQAVQAFLDSNPWFVRDQFLHDQMIAEHLAVIKKHPGLTEAQQLDKALTSLKGRFPDEFGITPAPKPTPAAAPESELVEEVEEEPAPRRNAPTPTPREATPLPRGRSHFEKIPQAEREEARKQFKRFQGFDEGLTEGEFVELYLNPNANIIEIQAKYRSKS